MWFRAKVQEALDDPSPGIPHDEVMADVRRVIQEARRAAVIWRPRALRQLENIGIYISKRNPLASDNLQALIEGRAERRPLHPYIHRPGGLPGIR